MPFTLPTLAQLEAMRADADKVIDAVVTVVDYVTKFGIFLPANVKDAAATLERDLQLAKSFLDHVPL